MESPRTAAYTVTPPRPYTRGRECRDCFDGRNAQADALSRYGYALRRRDAMKAGG